MKIELIKDGKVEHSISNVVEVHTDIDLYDQNEIKFRVKGDSKLYVLPDEYEVRISEEV